MTNKKDDGFVIDYDEVIKKPMGRLTMKKPFFGVILQSLPVRVNESVSTAALAYHKVGAKFEVIINPRFFMRLTMEQRVAILEHEVYHFINCHFLRFSDIIGFNKDDKEKEAQTGKDSIDTWAQHTVFNLATDLSINQLISDLPNGCDTCRGKRMWGDDPCPPENNCIACLFPEQFLDKQGKKFPRGMNAETYYKLLKDAGEEDKLKQKAKEGKQGDVGQGSVDDHIFEDDSALSAEQKKEMLEATKDVFERAMEKSSFSYDELDASIKDLLKKLEQEIGGLDAKSLLMQVVKRTISAFEKKKSWSRRNRRYGLYAPGNKLGDIPRVAFYSDNSGSISVKEQNEFLRTMDKFLILGQKKADIHFFHTKIFLSLPYRKGDEVGELESGGTDLEPVMKHIKENKPDLAIVLTDGYYGDVVTSPGSEVVFIISKTGQTNHPLTRFGLTVKLEDLKG